MPAEQQLLIAGAWRAAASGATHEVRNAYTGEVATVQAAAGRADAEAAVVAAAEAFADWSVTSPAIRRDVLVAAGDALQDHAAEIAHIVSEETAGTFGWGMFNVALAASMFRAAGALASEPTGEMVASDVPGLRSTAMRVPLGVCVGIAPWNAPVILAARAVVWALALGNTVVLKASEQSPRVHAAIAEALLSAGLPDGAINLITNDPADAAEVVGALIEHPETAHINFTGSTRVGAMIAAQAAPLFKRTLLELGGKAPLLVLDDADLEAAAAAASFGAFMNSGQICMSTERIVVDRTVHDAFVSQLAARAEALTTGSPFEDTTMVGPVVTAGASRRLRELVADARAKGARIVSGEGEGEGEGEDEREGGDGPVHRPTIVDGVTPAMRLYGEESFGPVVAVVTADGVDDAVRIANDTDYGLAAAVFGADVDRALAVASRIRSGICHVNGATVHDEATAPFGGVKSSGWGRFGSGEVVREFTTTRWITVSEQPRQYPL
ncbi:MAG: aldehyde dehydrogenase family protein [Solirubrobacterales bacterium]|nr:aldehyde dehydrogenase family protein [Solirubrobacterales bacterium]